MIPNSGFPMWHLLRMELLEHRRVLDSAAFASASVVDTDVRANIAMFAADIDTDGDVDVVTTLGSGTIAWYPNTDRTGSFGNRQVITTDADYLRDLIGADIDGDGDLDLLSASRGESAIIAWFENTTGQGSFGRKHPVSLDTDDVRSIHAADVDGDGDVDVVSASTVGDKVAWFENTNGLGAFGPEQLIALDRNGPRFLDVEDVDGDGDVDLIVANGREINWYQNVDGTGAFGDRRNIARHFPQPMDVYGVDVDGDNDIDVVSVSRLKDRITWYENFDGKGGFGAEHLITRSVSSSESLYVVDLDRDGDVDVLSASVENGKIAWYENDGQGEFASQCVITTGVNDAQLVYAHDIDGDGDVDVLSVTDDTLAWHENRIPGDVNGDGSFDTTDLVLVQQAGEYEDTDTGNSTFEEGDWNNDGDFTREDIVFALQFGKFGA